MNDQLASCLSNCIEIDAYEIEVGPLSSHSMIGPFCFKWAKRQNWYCSKTASILSKDLVGDPALEPIVKYQEDWVGTSGKMHAWGVTHSNWVLSQMSMRKILTKKEELKPPSTRLGILGHGPLGSLGWVESWKPVVQGKRRGGTGGANTVQCWLVAWSLTVPPNLWLDPPHQLTHCHQNWWRTVAWTSVSLEA